MDQGVEQEILTTGIKARRRAGQGAEEGRVAGGCPWQQNARASGPSGACQGTCSTSQTASADACPALTSHPPPPACLQVVDLLAPYQKGGKIGLFGGAGVGKTVLIMEVSLRLCRRLRV